MPRWFRSQAQVYNTFPDAMHSIRYFVEERMGEKKAETVNNENDEPNSACAEGGGFIVE